MLLRLFKEAIAALKKQRQSNMSVVFIAATRLKELDFWDSSPLGTSLKQLTLRFPRVKWNVSFENTQGLPTVYNRAIHAADSKDILVFIHDDVWLDSTRFIACLDEALVQYDIVGVAGNRRRVAGQPAWAFRTIENGELAWDAGHLSGAVLHGSPAESHVSEYGPFPAACELLDGVFMACLASTMKRNSVLYDERFNFHFYDMDLCRSARQRNLKLGTWGIPLIHQSTGNFGGVAWQQNYNAYIEKWRS